MAPLFFVATLNSRVRAENSKCVGIKPLLDEYTGRKVKLKRLRNWLK